MMESQIAYQLLDRFSFELSEETIPYSDTKLLIHQEILASILTFQSKFLCCNKKSELLLKNNLKAMTR
jgi:hypothetical protein